MLLDEFNYPLPAELIAQRPLAERDASRMMVVDRANAGFEDRLFRELPQILKPGDLLVFNNSRVFPARLLGRRRGVTAQTIGKNNPAAREHLSAEIEVLLTRQESENTWQALVRPGRKVRTGEMIEFGDGRLEGEVLGRGLYGIRRIRLSARAGTLEDAIDRLGHTPLPPYIRRPDEPADRAAYQTVYAKVRGAVAAPTAGFHFTERVLEELRARGVETSEITLHVGLGTFQPVRAERVEDHKMESERFEISDLAASAVNRALDEGRRVIAVAPRACARSNTSRASTAAGSFPDEVKPASSSTRASSLRSRAHSSRTFTCPGPRSSCWSAPLPGANSPSVLTGTQLSSATGFTATATACCCCETRQPVGTPFHLRSPSSKNIGPSGSHHKTFRNAYCVLRTR